MNWPTDKYRSQERGKPYEGGPPNGPTEWEGGLVPRPPLTVGRTPHPQEPSKRGSENNELPSPPARRSPNGSLLAPPTSNTKKNDPIRQTLSKSVTKVTRIMLTNPPKPDKPSQPSQPPLTSADIHGVYVHSTGARAKRGRVERSRALARARWRARARGDLRANTPTPSRRGVPPCSGAHVCAKACA